METGVSKKQALVSIASLVIILGGLYAIFRYFGITEVQTAVENAGVWAPLVLILAKASTIVIAPLSGSPLYPLAGALFGFWEGVLWLAIGDALGGIVAFYLSRIFGRHIVEKMLGAAEEKFLARVLRMVGTAKGFLVARICFAPMPEVVAYGAGLTRLNFVPFILIYVPIGLIPTMALAGLGSALTAGEWWVLPGVIVLGVVLVPLGALLFRYVLNEWDQTR